MGLEHVEALLALRGSPLPPVWLGRRPDAARRGYMKRLLLAALRDGPKSRGEMVTLVRAQRPELTPVAVGNRTDKALVKLRLAGLATREGRLWGLAGGVSVCHAGRNTWAQHHGRG